MRAHAMSLARRVVRPECLRRAPAEALPVLAVHGPSRRLRAVTRRLPATWCQRSSRRQAFQTLDRVYANPARAPGVRSSVAAFRTAAAATDPVVVGGGARVVRLTGHDRARVLAHGAFDATRRTRRASDPERGLGCEARPSRFHATGQRLRRRAGPRRRAFRLRSVCRAANTLASRGRRD
jgi:hypothetical protein